MLTPFWQLCMYFCNWQWHIKLWWCSKPGPEGTFIKLNIRNYLKPYCTQKLYLNLPCHLVKRHLVEKGSFLSLFILVKKTSLEKGYSRALLLTSTCSHSKKTHACLHGSHRFTVRWEIWGETQPISIYLLWHLRHSCIGTIICSACYAPDIKWWTQAHREQRDTGRWIKHCFFIYCHSYCFRQTSCGAGSTEWFKQVNATADLQTNLSDNNKQQRRSKKRSKKNSFWQPLTSWKKLQK